MPASREKTERSGSRPGLRVPTSDIAWAGWQMPIEEDWRPLKIEGGQAQGAMMIGDSEQPIVRVQWSRAREPDRFDADAWIAKRIKKMGAIPSANVPRAPSFDRTAWVKDLAAKEGTTRTIWYGYSAAARLMLELIVTSLTAENIRKRVLRSVVPRMKVSPAGEPCNWSLYGIGFTCPAGFELKRRHLYSGDIALQFEREKATLLMRQVYPAALAASRRSLARWLQVSPFKERRRLRNANSCPWRRDGQRMLEGVKQEGWKRLPSPLGFVARRYSTAIAATDGALDRLLVAELQTRRPQGEEIAEWVIERMNGG